MKPEDSAVNAPVNLFISSSKKDEQFKSEISAHLSPLEQQGLLRCWHETDIEPGSNIGEAVQGYFDQSEIILILLSSDYIAAPEDYESFMKLARQRSKAGSAFVMPVLLRPVHLELDPIAGLKMLPANGIPVSMQVNKDQSYAEIASEVGRIARLIKKDGTANAFSKIYSTVTSIRQTDGTMDKNNSRAPKGLDDNGVQGSRVLATAIETSDFYTAEQHRSQAKDSNDELNGQIRHIEIALENGDPKLLTAFLRTSPDLRSEEIRRLCQIASGNAKVAFAVLEFCQGRSIYLERHEFSTLIQRAGQEDLRALSENARKKLWLCAIIYNLAYEASKVGMRAWCKREIQRCILIIVLLFVSGVAATGNALLWGRSGVYINLISVLMCVAGLFCSALAVRLSGVLRVLISCLKQTGS